MGNLMSRMNKQKQTKNARRQDVVGNVALWEGSGKVALSGRITFGDYKDPANCVTYGILLFEASADKSYVLSGIVIMDEGKARKERGQKRPPLGRVYVYESATDQPRMVVFMGQENEEQTKYFCTIKESKSDNPKSPIYYGSLNNDVSSSKSEYNSQYVAESKQALEQSAEGWYGPSDLIEIITTYNEQQFEEFAQLFLNSFYRQLEPGSLSKVEPEHELPKDAFEYVEPSAGDTWKEVYEDKYGSLEEQLSELPSNDEEDDEEIDVDDMTDMPDVRVSGLQLVSKPRIADITRGTFSRVKSQIEGVEDVTSAEELM